MPLLGVIPCRHIDEPYLYLYLWGGWPKPPSAEAMYVRPNVQPQYDQRSGKPLSGSRKPKKSYWLMNNISQKFRANGPCISEDKIILCSFLLTQYRLVTDRQTDKNAVARTVLSTAACCKNGNSSHLLC